jgi:hypothetical protein
MSALFRKLNLKDQTSILVLQAPASFESALAELTGVTVHRKAPRAAKFSFAVGFAVTQKALDAVSQTLTAVADGDAVLWIAYPKQSSKRYTCEFNRDSGWQVLGAAGYEPVRMVAIDEDWSALRFRRAEMLKTMTRSPAMALSAVGKARTRKKT